LILAEVYSPWQQRCGHGPWEFFAPLIGLGYQFLFLCRGGLIEYSPSESAPFPPEFEHGYNVVAHVPDRHAERMRGLERLRFGTGQALPVAQGIYPSRPLPR
jgi:hypothetical protein